MKHSLVLAIGFLGFVLQTFQPALCYETNTSLVRKKLCQPSIHNQAELNGGSNRKYNLPQVRKITLRDSGREETLMFIKNVQFSYLGNVGFYTPNLAVSLKPNNPESPVIFDDPTSFSIHIHQGDIILSSERLNTLLNQQVFNYQGSPIRNVKASTAPDSFTLSGEMFRGKWIPFLMKGKISLKEGHLLIFTPSTVIVDNVDASKVLAVANVKLDELLKIKTSGAELVGSSMVLDAKKLFPPPVLSLNISSLKINEQGMVLTLDDGKHPRFPSPLASGPSYMMVMGGDIKIERSIPLNVTMQINSVQPSEVLNFCLYRYRDQLAKGRLSLSSQGYIHVFLGNPDCSLTER